MLAWLVIELLGRITCCAGHYHSMIQILLVWHLSFSINLPWLDPWTVGSSQNLNKHICIASQDCKVSTYASITTFLSSLCGQLCDWERFIPLLTNGRGTGILWLANKSWSSLSLSRVQTVEDSLNGKVQATLRYSSTQQKLFIVVHKCRWIMFGLVIQSALQTQLAWK